MSGTVDKANNGKIGYSKIIKVTKAASRKGLKNLVKKLAIKIKEYKKVALY